jgi:hypothetical protein
LPRPQSARYSITSSARAEQRLRHGEAKRLGCLELVEALDRARSILKTLQIAPDPSPDDPELMGYVILDYRGRQVARGYRRDPVPPQA